MGVSDGLHGHGAGPAPHDERAHRNELIFQCIMSDQVPEDELGALMEDAGFRAYFEQRIRLVRASGGSGGPKTVVPPHAAGLLSGRLLSGVASWFQGWRGGTKITKI